MIYDIAVIGGGPAGYSAALTVLQKNKTVCVIRPSDNQSYLLKAEKVNNYLGMPGLNGAQMIAYFENQAKESGTVIIDGIAKQIFKNGETFLISIGTDFIEAKKLIIATGMNRPKGIKGEHEFLGKGVSYCGTCDGMLYKNKIISVIAKSSEAVHELEFLSKLAKKIYLSSQETDFKKDYSNVEQINGVPQEIKGTDRVNSIIAGDREYLVDGVFIFRNTTAFSTLFPDLIIENNFIKTDANMQTNIDGVYAAGDCTGPPFQVMKAAGEGNSAAYAAN